MSPRARYVAFALIVVGLLGGAMAVIAAPPCVFTEPSGPVALQLTNDGELTVDVAACLDDRCTDATGRTRIEPRAAGRVPLGGCGHGTLAVLDPGTSTLTACIPEPTVNWRGRLSPLLVSAAGPCPRAVRGQQVHLEPP